MRVHIVNSPAINVRVESQKLGAALTAYQQLSGRTPAEVVEKKGRDLRMALYRRFFAVQPPAGKIPADVRARGYRVGRKALGGFVSPFARSAAAKILGGNKTVYGRVVDGAGSAGLLRTIRVGARGKRITGGRIGRGGRAATASEAAQFRVAGEHRLTRRNLEVHFETVLRERGRGYLGSSFLALRRRRGTAAERMAGRPYRIVANPARTAFTYRISEEVAVLPNLSRFAIETNQEGIAERDSIIAAAYSDVRSDTLAYCERKLAEYARKAGLQ